MRSKFPWLFYVGLLCTAFPSYADKPKQWQMGFQEAATPVMERVSELHHTLLIIITCVAIFVGALLLYVIFRFNEKRNPVPSKRSHHTVLEIVWTLVPVVILGFIAAPSLKLLYFMDKIQDAEVTIKVTGHQWYWEYDYPDQKINYNSNMIPSHKIQPGQIRMLDVDNPVVLPVDTNVRVLVTSADVIHSWAVPSFGVKLDTVPGHLRETWVRIHKPGVYYGQCSELCGQGHGFMSIAVKAVSKEEFKQWLASQAPAQPAPTATPTAKTAPVTPPKPQQKQTSA